jgi:hypothetical protein
MFINWNWGTPMATTWGVQIDEYDQAVVPGVNDIGHWRVYGMRRAGSTLSARLDGAMVGSPELFGHAAGVETLGAEIDVSATGVDLDLGAQVHPGLPTNLWANADVAEIVAVGGSITTQDLNGLEGYLTTKYAIH